MPEAASPKTLGQFEITGELGRGGMAVVFRGYQPSLDRHVAIKTLPSDRATRDMVTRFKREVSTMVALNHTNIVQIIDSGEEQGLHYYAMEFVDGPDLKGLMKDGLTVDQAFDIAAQICDGLGYAHKKGMIHRDVKPANVLWEASTGLAKIADFGIAKDVSMVTLTGTDVGMGTMNYMAPEQKQQARDVDHRADVYAVGVVVYEMFTGGKLPMGRFKMPSELTPGLPRSLDDVVAKCLEFNAEDRYDTLEEVKQALAKARQDVGAGGSQKLLSIRDAAEKTLTAVASSASGGGLVIGLCLFAMLTLGAVGAGALYVFVIRPGSEVAGGDPDASPTASADASPSTAPTEAASESPKPSPSASKSPKPSPSASESPKPSPSASESPKPSPSANESPKPSPSASESPKPSESPQPTEPPSVELTAAQQNLVLDVDDAVAAVAAYSDQYGRLSEVERSGGAKDLEALAVKVRATGDVAAERTLRQRLDVLRLSMRDDLLDLVTRRNQAAESILGMDPTDYRRFVSEMQQIGRLQQIPQQITRYARLLDDLLWAEVQAYKVQAQAAFSLAVQRAPVEAWRPLAEELEAIGQAPREQLAELARRAREAVTQVRRAGIPGDLEEIAPVAQLLAKDIGVDALTSVCQGEDGGVAAIGVTVEGQGRNKVRSAYLLLIREADGQLEVVARQRVIDGAYWVASAGRRGGSSSYWVAESQRGVGTVIRYGFQVRDGVREEGELEQFEVELYTQENEYIQDLAPGADGKLHVLTNWRALTYFGEPGARRLVAEVRHRQSERRGDFADFPMTQRIAPLVGDDVVITGDTRSADAVKADRVGGIFSPETQSKWRYVPLHYSYGRTGRQRVGAETSRDPLALVGLGDRLLGVSYGKIDGGQFLEYADVGRSGRAVPVRERGSKIVLASDLALVRGNVYVLDVPTDQRHDRQRLLAFRSR